MKAIKRIDKGIKPLMCWNKLIYSVSETLINKNKNRMIKKNKITGVSWIPIFIHSHGLVIRIMDTNFKKWIKSVY